MPVASAAPRGADVTMRALAVMIALEATGCCWEVPRACIQGADRCYDIPTVLCLDEREDDESLIACGASWRDGSCAHHGFTKRCEGGYSVPPGSSC